MSSDCNSKSSIQVTIHYFTVLHSPSVLCIYKVIVVTWRLMVFCQKSVFLLIYKALHILWHEYMAWHCWCNDIVGKWLKISFYVETNCQIVSVYFRFTYYKSIEYQKCFVWKVWVDVRACWGIKPSYTAQQKSTIEIPFQKARPPYCTMITLQLYDQTDYNLACQFNISKLYWHMLNYYCE